MSKALLLPILLGLLAPCAAEPLATYEERLEVVRGELQGAVKAQAADEAIWAAQRKLKEVTEVSLPSGEEVRVDNSALLGELEAALVGEEQKKGERIEEVVGRVASLAGAVALYHKARQGEAIGPTSQQATAALKEVLRRREFRRGPAQRGWSGLMRLLWRVVGRILEATGKAGRVVGWIVIALGGLALVGVAVSLALRIAGSGRARWKMSPEETPRKPSEAEPATADEALRCADEARKRGDYREALRCLYQALLLLLGERGLIRYGKGTTNWEYVRALRASSAESGATLAASTLLFERRWYGWMPATEADYGVLMERLAALRETQAKGKAGP